MSESRYDLVLNGIPNGIDIDPLKQHMSTLCQVSPAALDLALGELMAGVRKAVILRKRLPVADAEQLKAALETNGLACMLVASLGLVPREVTVEKKEYVCPACDHKQPYTEAQDDAPCANCGVIRSKYLKNENTRKAIERERRLREIKKQNEIEQHLRDEEAREKKQIAETARKQIGRERRLDAANRLIGRWRAMSGPYRAGCIILLLAAFPAAYFLPIYDTGNHETKPISVEPQKNNLVGGGAAEQYASQAPTQGHRPETARESDSPESLSHDALPRVESAQPINITLGNGTGTSGRAADLAPDAENMESLVPGPVTVEEPGAIALTSGESTAATVEASENGAQEGVREEPNPTSEVSTGANGNRDSGSVSTKILDSDGSEISVGGENSGWRGTMHHALSIARGIEDASERAKWLAVLASVYTEMADTEAAQDTLADAIKAVTAGDIARDLTGALSKIAKAKSEVWAVKSLAQRKREEGQPASDAVTVALETARTIPGALDRAVALGTIAKHLALSGQASHAKVVFTEAFGVARVLASKGERVSALGDIAWDLAEAGDMESAQWIADRMREDAETIVNVQERVTALGALAVTASSWERGMATVQELLSESSRLAQGILDPSERGRVTDTMTISMIQSLSRGASILTAAGKNDEARAKLEHAANLVGKIKAPGDQIAALASIVKAHVGMPGRQPGVRLLDVKEKAQEVAYGSPASATK